MTTHTQIRFEIAEQIKVVCLSYKSIIAIAITGSTAINETDQFSDIEIALFWQKRPTMPMRNRLIAQLNGVATRQTTPKSSPYWMGVDNLIINQLCIDMVHNKIALFEKRVKEVLYDLDTTIEKQKLLFVIKYCQPIYGEEQLQALKQKVSIYPDTLQKLILVKYSRIPPLGGILVSVLREDSPSFYAQVNRYVQHVYILLLALNKEYFPSTKRKLKHIEQLDIKPMGIAEKLNSVYELNFLQAYDILKEVVIEVFEMVVGKFEDEQIQKNFENFLKVRRRNWETAILKQWDFHRSINFETLTAVKEREQQK